jgi:hypothetical protein
MILRRLVEHHTRTRNQSSRSIALDALLSHCGDAARAAADVIDGSGASTAGDIALCQAALRPPLERSQLPLAAFAVLRADEQSVSAARGRRRDTAVWRRVEEARGGDSDTLPNSSELGSAVTRQLFSVFI